MLAYGRGCCRRLDAGRARRASDPGVASGSLAEAGALADASSLPVVAGWRPGLFRVHGRHRGDPDRLLAGIGRVFGSSSPLHMRLLYGLWPVFDGGGRALPSSVADSARTATVNAARHQAEGGPP